MFPFLERTALIYGPERLARLAAAHVLVVGTGGVGSWAAEMLARGGVGRLTIIDADSVSLSNINRQLPALRSTVGRAKTDVMAERLSDINPDLQLTALSEYLEADRAADLLDRLAPDFTVDAIDTVRPKVALLAAALRCGRPVVSSMGAGAKTDISQVRQADLWTTCHCGLARAVRDGLKREGLKGRRLPVVFSTEPPQRSAIIEAIGEREKLRTAGTVSYLPAAFGLHLSAYVLEHL